MCTKGIRLFITILLCGPLFSYAQQTQADSLLKEATLENVIQYAILNQPGIQQAELDEEITETAIRTRLGDWYPNITMGAAYQHNIVIQSMSIGGNIIKAGVKNSSSLQFSATQNLINRDLILASMTARNVRAQAKQNTQNNKITLAVNVTKAFYDVLVTTQQISVSKEEIRRLEQNLKNTTDQYRAGTADKTDYKRTTIALNNAKAGLKSNEELLKAKHEYLKFLIGYPASENLELVYDTLNLERSIELDTTSKSNYRNRIEYQLLETSRRLQTGNLKYSRWAYAPSLTASGAYNFNYLSNEFNDLYNRTYPNSFVGLNLSVPIFQGTKRIQSVKQQKLQLRRIDLDIKNLENAVNSEHAQAIAVYKSYLANYHSLKENLELAQEVYDVINLQYRSGVKTYLEVITAESDLRAAKINYYNALYQLLSAKIDVQRALGQLNY
jgi:outer membrane protein